MRRLEAATSRLEDIASSAIEGQPQPVAGDKSITTNGVSATTPSEGMAAVIAGTVTSQSVTPTPSPSPSANATSSPVPVAKEELPEAVAEFDVLINGDLKAYHELSKTSAVGGLLGEQVG